MKPSLLGIYPGDKRRHHCQDSSIPKLSVRYLAVPEYHDICYPVEKVLRDSGW